MPSRHQTFKYADLLTVLTGCDDWLREIGVPIKNNDRIHFAIQVLRDAENGSRMARETGEIQKIGNINDFLFGITEALEFHDIMTFLAGADRASLREKLDRALSGPMHPIEEGPSNRDGRNIMFELALSAEWASRGATVRLEAADFVIAVDGANFLVECKRPDSRNSIGTCVRKASEQLAELLEPKPAAHGLIAVSLARVLNKGDKFFAKNEERLGDVMEKLIHEESDQWRGRKFHERISALLFHVGTPADPEGKGLVRMTYTVASPLGNDDASKRFVEALKAMYAD